MTVPDHILAIANEACVAMRQVLADWCEERNDKIAATALRKGGADALAELIRLTRAGHAALYLNGSQAFTAIEDLKVSIERSVDPTARTELSVRVLCSGSMRAPEHTCYEAVVLLDGRVTRIRPTAVTTTNDLRGDTIEIVGDVIGTDTYEFNKNEG